MRRGKKTAAYVLSATMLATGFAGVPCNELRAAEIFEKTNQNEMNDVATVTEADTETSVVINATNFPDANFRTYVAENFDTDQNGVLSYDERSAVTSIVVGYYDYETEECIGMDISNLEGIELFFNLVHLECSYNHLVSLDISKNTQLVMLDCDGNSLTSLDVSRNSNLEFLYCFNNQITSLDVSRNSNLKELYCGGNQITSLNVSQNPNLEELNCVYNQLTSIDVSQNLNLNLFKCDGNIYYVSSRTIDTSTFPNFDSRKVLDVYDGKLVGNVFVMDGTTDTLTYDYDCGQDRIVSFQLKLDAPETPEVPGTVTLESATASATAITVNWNVEPNADSYVVYRKNAGTSWKKIGTSNTTSYTDKTAVGGTKYYYTVKAVNEIGTSETYDTTGVSATITALPGKVVLKPATIGATAIKVNWEPTATASSYIIYRHAAGESWKKIGTSTTTSYLDSTAIGGKNYAYTVKAVNGNGAATSYDKTGIIAKITALPGKVTLLDPTVGKTAIKVNWKATPTASSYIIYRHAKGEAWTKIGTSTTTSYVDATAVGGKNYAYTVKAVNGNGTSTSYDKTGVVAKITALPGITTMIGATAYTGYIQVKWKATPTASSYAVYRKTAGGKWTKIGTTTKTAYNDKTAVKGTTYYYTVIATNGNGACKTYDTTGVKATAK